METTMVSHICTFPFFFLLSSLHLFHFTLCSEGHFMLRYYELSVGRSVRLSGFPKLSLLFISWYDVSHAMGFRVCGDIQLK